MLTTRLIKGRSGGSAPVETVFAIVILMVLVLGTIEVTFALYARNVIAASAHEGARAAVELGTTPAEIQQVAESTVRRSAGGLVTALEVSTAMEQSTEREVVQVAVRGAMKPFGPVPLRLTFESLATAVREDTGG